MQSVGCRHDDDAFPLNWCFALAEVLGHLSVAVTMEISFWLGDAGAGACWRLDGGCR